MYASTVYWMFTKSVEYLQILHLNVFCYLLWVLFRSSSVWFRMFQTLQVIVVFSSPQCCFKGSFMLCNGTLSNIFNSCIGKAYTRGCNE
jgi:hypothetical protein